MVERSLRVEHRTVPAYDLLTAIAFKGVLVPHWEPVLFHSPPATAFALMYVHATIVEMPKPPGKKRPKDANQLAKLIADIATGEVEDKPDYGDKNPAAVELGRRGGKKGGAARAAKLTQKERKRIAKVAAEARWRKKK